MTSHNERGRSNYMRFTSSEGYQTKLFATYVFRARFDVDRPVTSAFNAQRDNIFESIDRRFPNRIVRIIGPEVKKKFKLPLAGGILIDRECGCLARDDFDRDLANKLMKIFRRRGHRR
jgi:hypothetical protein